MSTDRPKPRRRFFRYSLRALMLVVTLFCIWMGWQAKRARDQQRAVAPVLAAGGFVQYDSDHGQSYWALPPARRPGFKSLHSIIPAQWNLWLRDWLRPVVGRHFVDNVVTVGFSYPSVENRSFIQQQVRDGKINDSTDFKDFASLPYPPLTDEDWKLLQKLSTLEEMHIFGMVTDNDLRHVSRIPNLRVILGFSGDITHAGLVHLKEARSLSILQINGPTITASGLRSLEQALPNCRINYIDP